MRIRLPALRFPLHRLASHLRQSFPIGMTELAWAFSWYFVTVLLGMLFDHEPLSYFGASHRVLMALHTFVWLYFFNLLPSISRCKGQPSGHLLDLIQPSLRLAAWTSVFVAFLMTAISRDALSLVYGRPFAEAGTSFSILVWMLPIAMMSGHYRYILIGFNLQRRLFQCTAASAVAAIALGLLLAPRFGASGGAWALVAANAVNFALVHAAVRREVLPIPFWGELVRPAFALITGISIFLLARQWNSVWLAAAAGSLAYIAVLALSLGRQALNLIFPARGEPIDSMEDCAG
jgi:O-antigen/teichoic acid export membrane protein